MRFTAQASTLQAIELAWLACFFTFTAWKFDKFAALAGPLLKSNKQHKFRTIMLYCYILGCPAFITQGAAYAYIKYTVGTVPFSEGGMTLPWEQWPQHFQRLILPLEIMVALAWSAEMVTLLEETLFFIRLVLMTPSSPPWFSSRYFRGVIGGIGVIFLINFGAVGLGYSRKDPVAGDAVIYLSGSVGLIASNIAYSYVLWRLPQIIKNLRKVGGSRDVMQRLLLYQEINKIRVAARWLVGIGHATLSIDALTSRRITRTPWASDLLVFLATSAFLVQATCSIMIFLPRNLEAEADAYSDSDTVDLRRNSYLLSPQPAGPKSPREVFANRLTSFGPAVDSVMPPIEFGIEVQRDVQITFDPPRDEDSSILAVTERKSPPPSLLSRRRRSSVMALPAGVPSQIWSFRSPLEVE